ncbi:MAG: flippase-like domain-containing protein [Candidatus Dadabacteria bacterium]|nr:flippase-like domain-containing protein [Candidatus Dadabacteria bacterium]
MKKLISFIVSLIILAVIYWKIDFHGLIKVLRNCNVWLMTIGLGMILPLTLLTARRLQQLMPHRAKLGFIDANRLILLASFLNMIFPSKMGDIAKAYFVKEDARLEGSFSLSLVVFEKTCDMISLLIWCAFGLTLYPKKDWFFWLMTGIVIVGLIACFFLLGSRKFSNLFFTILKTVSPNKLGDRLEGLKSSWYEMHDHFWGDKIQLFKIAGTSIFIWFLHLLQIWLFILALNAWAPFLANLALAPLAILAGLLPFTFAGVGTRDAALILLYEPFFNASTAAALGLLCTTRYLIPAICGLPFIGKYLSKIHNLGIKPDRFWQAGS